MIMGCIIVYICIYLDTRFAVSDLRQRAQIEIKPLGESTAETEICFNHNSPFIDKWDIQCVFSCFGLSNSLKKYLCLVPLCLLLS